MDVFALLNGRRDLLVRALVEGLRASSAPHYHAMDPSLLRERAGQLSDALLAALQGDGPALLLHVRRIAEVRLTEGFTLAEVQRALNLLEEAAWTQVVSQAPAEAQAAMLALVTTALGTAKDHLARLYLEHAAHGAAAAHAAPAHVLFRGTVSAPELDDELGGDPPPGPPI